jgi:hypothetical protein
MAGPKNIVDKFNIYSKYFGLLMMVVYMVVGLLLIFSENFLDFLNKTTKFVLGIILIGYGIFRAYRALRTARNEKAD